MHRPTIGITLDNRENDAGSGRYESSIAYSRAVAETGGLPVLLPHEPALAALYVQQCDGLLLTGGADPLTEGFGEPTHAQAQRMDARRQAFELALLAAVQEQSATPVLGVCLGMQLMALHAGGRLDQHLPETLTSHADHLHDRRHGLSFDAADSVLQPVEGQVVSHHRQAVTDAGRLRVVAKAHDGVIEAIDDPARPFYLGVQWHPERGGAGPLNHDLIACLVRAAGASVQA